MLNALLHEIVSKLGHTTEHAAAELHAMVDQAVPAPEADTPDADATEAGGTTPTKAK